MRLRLLRDRLHDPALIRFGEFARGETPDDHFFLREISGIGARLAIETHAHCRRPRAARADEIWREAEILGQLIHQAGAFGVELVKDEGVTISHHQHWAIRVRLNWTGTCRVADSADRDLLRARFGSIISQTSKISGDADLLPCGYVFLARRRGSEFRANLLRDRLARENTTQP